jgi:hypothetical protein
MTTPTFDEIEGMEADKVHCVNLGNGFATYALCKGLWWSVNTCNELIQDVRWQASATEAALLKQFNP